MYTSHTNFTNSSHAPLGSVRRQGPPFSSLRERPLSIASTLSAASFLSTTSSTAPRTGERRRRSVVLLDLDVDDTTRSSLLRAEQVLRASEQDRRWDSRRHGWRERAASGLYADEFATGSRNAEGLDGSAATMVTAAGVTLKRFSPQRLLRKTPFVPSDVLLGTRDGSRAISPIISAPLRKSPSPPKAHAPRRAASTADLLTSGSSTVKHNDDTKRPMLPPQQGRFGTLPLRLSRLPLPQNEPQSKFSASSGDSMVHVVAFRAEADKPRRGLKDRARTFSQASTGGLKSLRSKVGKPRSTRLKHQRSGLANLFAGLGGSSDEGQQKQGSAESDQPTPISSDTSGHRPSTSVSSYAPSSAVTTSDSSQPHRKPSRLGFFRSTLKRDSTATNRTSVRTRSSGQVSPSIISRPSSLSTSERFSLAEDKRASEVTKSSHSSGEGQSGDVQIKVGWATRLTRVVKGQNVAAKKTLFAKQEARQREDTVHSSGTASSPDVTARAPSHIPLASVFSQAAPPARPARPSKNLDSSDDTTFYGHRIPDVKLRVAAFEGLAIQTRAPRVRPKTSSPVTKSKIQQSQNAQSDLHATHESFEPVASRDPQSTSDAVLLPAAPIYSAHSIPHRRYTPDSFDVSDSSLSPVEHASASYLSSSEDGRCASPARSFRSPSPARFRALQPSIRAGSSPEKNARGLPMPQEASPKSIYSRDSPRKRAMGPEQIILMEDAKQPPGPFTEVCGATTDLADLLSGLEDTEIYNTSRLVEIPNLGTASGRHLSDLSMSLRGQLPHVDSIESLRSSISDVPLELKQLMTAVDDHISEIDIPHIYVERSGMAAHGFADEDSISSSSSSSSDSSENDARGAIIATLDQGRFDEGFLSVGGQRDTRLYAHEDATRFNSDVTASSFEGHFSTAAAALRSMLGHSEAGVSSAPLPGSATLQAFPIPSSATVQAFQFEQRREESPSQLRDSVREALDLGRPSNGDRMFDDIDDAVPLVTLVQGESPYDSPDMILAHAREGVFLRNHLRSASGVSSSEGTGESMFSLMGSPSPLPPTGRPERQSLARYSQDRFPVRRPSHRARPTSEQSSMSSSEQEQHSMDPTTSSIPAPSMRSTNLSVSSTTSSPCPANGRRRIPMLTSSAVARRMPLAFRFPPVQAGVVAQQTREWVASGDSKLESSGHQGASDYPMSEPPRFVRPLSRSSVGEPLPPPRPLDLDLDVNLVSPDTPPPSSPSDGELHTCEYVKITQASVQFAQAVAGGAERKSRHQRQASRSSSIMQSVIVEEADIAGASRECSESAVRQSAQPLSTIPEPTSPSSPQSVTQDAGDASPNVRIELAEVEYFSTARVIELESHDDFDFTAETNPEVTSRYFSISYEAETELKRSLAIWPDSEYSREVIAHWIAPRTYYAILEFIFYSQLRFPSRPQLARLGSWLPPAFDDPPTPPSPIRIPPPIVDSPPEVVDATVVSQIGPIRRMPFAAKAVNRQLADLTQSTLSASKRYKEGLSPFTALPPRLGSKFRSMRGKVAGPKGPRQVDTAFLGGKATIRRQGQYEAVMRKLEGTGVPAEQRSDEETDDTGVLEGKGEATQELSFTKTPGLSSRRPSVRRRVALAGMR